MPPKLLRKMRRSSRSGNDDIVKPAYDRAWQDSGLTTVTGASLNFPARVLPATGRRTRQDVYPAAGFLERKRKDNPAPVCVYWPSWTDTKFPLGTEGRYTGLRSEIYLEAWRSITGMLKDHPQLAAYQNPILLAVCRCELHVNTRLDTQDKFKCVAQDLGSAS